MQTLTPNAQNVATNLGVTVGEMHLPEFKGWDALRDRTIVAAMQTSRPAIEFYPSRLAWRGYEPHTVEISEETGLNLDETFVYDLAKMVRKQDLILPKAMKWFPHLVDVLADQHPSLDSVILTPTRMHGHTFEYLTPELYEEYADKYCLVVTAWVAFYPGTWEATTIGYLAHHNFDPSFAEPIYTPCVSARGLDRFVLSLPKTYENGEKQRVLNRRHFLRTQRDNRQRKMRI